MESTSRYKTRTDIRSRANGGVKGIWLCAADFGYSSVKIFSQNTIAVFPSFAIKFSGETIGTLPDSHITYRDLLTGEQWLVGESAQNDVGQNDSTISEESIWGRRRYDDPMFLVLVRVGLGLGTRKNDFGDPSGKTVYVQTGLPPKYLKKDTSKLVKAIAGRHRFALRVGNTPEEIFDITIEPGNVDVMEQPKGTLWSVAIDNSHRFIRGSQNYFNKNVLVFDAGFETLDIFPIINNHSGEKQTFTQFSMHQVLRDTIQAIYEEYNEEVSMIGIQRCLGEGFIRCHDKFSSHNEPFADILEKCSRRICDQALEKFGQIYVLSEYDYLIITGGTGAAWNEQIREKLKGLSSLAIIDGNQNDTSLPFLFANVRGYYMRLYNKMYLAMRESK